MGIIDTFTRFVSGAPAETTVLEQHAQDVAPDTNVVEQQHSRKYRRRRDALSDLRIEKAIMIYAEIEEVAERLEKQGGSPSQAAVAIALLLADRY